MATRFEAEKFSGKNDFALWQIKMRALLIQQGLDDAIEPIDLKEKGKVELDEKEALKKAQMAKKAHSAIVLNLTDKVLREVSKETTAYGVWAKLENLYMTKSLANRLYMKQRLFSYKILEDRPFAEQIDDFSKNLDDLENVDGPMKNEDKAILLLNALPKSYQHLKDAMLFGRNAESGITFEEVQCALRSKELEKSSNGQIEGGSQALNVKQFKGKKKKGANGSKNPQQSKQFDGSGKETRSCHYCKKPGHLKKDCFSWKKKQAEVPQNQADVALEAEPAQVLNVVDRGIEKAWIMDSGCSFHICSCREWFENFHDATGSVILGNDQVCSIRGIGDIRLRTYTGAVKIITQVRYIPDIKRNLISVGVLESKGFKITSEKGHMTVSNDGVDLMRAKRKNSLYYLEAEAVVGTMNVVEKSDFEKWHKRLGHIGETGLKELAKRGVIQLEASSKLSVCESCVLGKSKKLPYEAGIHSSKEILDYAHSDLWGPAQTSSMGVGRYFLSIIDDFSRKVWIYILKEKSQTFEKFREWCQKMKLKTGKILKCLRTDNGLEFLSSDFQTYCKENGMQRHRTVPANPQQNGVAERMNRTLLERVRCMLLSSGLPKIFWAEAVSTAAVLINNSPSSAISYEIPNTRWYGKESNYKALKIFGCRAYAHSKQGKLDPRALKCVMIGYQEGVKGYRLWCTEKGNQKVIVSRDVVFDEDMMPYLRSDTNTQTYPVSTTDQRKDDNETSSAEEQGDNSGGGGADDIADTTGQSSTAPETPQNSGYKLSRDRVRRQIKPPSRFSDYEMSFFALCVAEVIEHAEPANYAEAMKSKEREKWLKAMHEEIESLLKNMTWILIKNPLTQKVISCKWIFKKKVEAGDSDSIRFKARLVARGFTQEEGVDFNEVFSPVVKHTSIRILLALVAKHDWVLHQLDVKTAFLHGDLEETIYMHQPEGFEVPGSEGMVCLLKKSLYGLKQSSRQWYIKFDEHITAMGFRKSDFDSCVYIREKKGIATVFLLLYVDDMLVAAPDIDEVMKVKSELELKFEMKDLGEARRILGMDIIRDRGKRELRLIQSDYIQRLLLKFQMNQSKAVSTPLASHFKLSMDQRPKSEAERVELSKIPYANIIGSIMYTMLCTRPDLAQAISVTSRFMSDHGREHWAALKWVLRYLKGASRYGLIYGGKDHQQSGVLIGFCDSDFASNRDNRRSQTGYVFNLYGTAISWKSGLQHVVALSTTEAEYIAITEAVKEAKWLKGILEDFGEEQGAVEIFCDSSSALALTKHQIFHERSKHIDVKLHFVRDEIQKGEIKMLKVSTDHNAADMLTKALPAQKFRYCLELVGLRE